jgi:predicted transcriptional regulator
LRVARKANLTVREDIADRFERGDTQLQIAKDLGISPASVRYYLRLAGVPGAIYGRRELSADGRRICSRCGKAKTPGAFPTERDATPFAGCAARLEAS